LAAPVSGGVLLAPAVSRPLTFLFVDIRGYTQLRAELKPSHTDGVRSLGISLADTQYLTELHRLLSPK